MNVKALVTVAAAIGGLLYASSAGASVTVCNKTSHSVWIAVADTAVNDPNGSFDYGTNMCDSSTYTEKYGWYQATAGQCLNLNGADACDFAWYFYAEDSVGDVWDSGPSYDTFCTPWSAYDLCTNAYGQDTTCNTSGGQNRFLHYMEFQPTTSDWTLNLIP